MESAEKDRKEAEEALKKATKALADAKAFILALPNDQLAKMNYAALIAEVRKRFPETAGLAQWVKDTAIKVPELKGKLPSKKALMEMVEWGGAQRAPTLPAQMDATFHDLAQTWLQRASYESVGEGT